MFEVAIHPVTQAIMAGLGSQPMSAPAARLLSQVMQWQEGELARNMLCTSSGVTPLHACVR